MQEKIRKATRGEGRGKGPPSRGTPSTKRCMSCKRRTHTALAGHHGRAAKRKKDPTAHAPHTEMRRPNTKHGVEWDPSCASPRQSLGDEIQGEKRGGRPHPPDHPLGTWSSESSRHQDGARGEANPHQVPRPCQRQGRGNPVHPKGTLGAPHHKGGGLAWASAQAAKRATNRPEPPGEGGGGEK